MAADPASTVHRVSSRLEGRSESDEVEKTKNHEADAVADSGNEPQPVIEKRRNSLFPFAEDDVSELNDCGSVVEWQLRRSLSQIAHMRSQHALDIDALQKEITFAKRSEFEAHGRLQLHEAEQSKKHEQEQNLPVNSATVERRLRLQAQQQNEVTREELLAMQGFVTKHLSGIDEERAMVERYSEEAMAELQSEVHVLRRENLHEEAHCSKQHLELNNQKIAYTELDQAREKVEQECTLAKQVIARKEGQCSHAETMLAMYRDDLTNQRKLSDNEKETWARAEERVALEMAEYEKVKKEKERLQAGFENWAKGAEEIAKLRKEAKEAKTKITSLELKTEETRKQLTTVRAEEAEAQRQIVKLDGELKLQQKVAKQRLDDAAKEQKRILHDLANLETKCEITAKEVKKHRDATVAVTKDLEVAKARETEVRVSLSASEAREKEVKKIAAKANADHKAALSLNEQLKDQCREVELSRKQDVETAKMREEKLKMMAKARGDEHVEIIENLKKHKEELQLDLQNRDADVQRLQVQIETVIQQNEELQETLKRERVENALADSSNTCQKFEQMVAQMSAVDMEMQDFQKMLCNASKKVGGQEKSRFSLLPRVEQVQAQAEGSPNESPISRDKATFSARSWMSSPCESYRKGAHPLESARSRSPVRFTTVTEPEEELLTPASANNAVHGRKSNGHKVFCVAHVPGDASRCTDASRSEKNLFEPASEPWGHSQLVDDTLTDLSSFTNTADCSPHHHEMCSPTGGAAEPTFNYQAGPSGSMGTRCEEVVAEAMQILDECPVRPLVPLFADPFPGGNPQKASGTAILRRSVVELEGMLVPPHPP